MNSEDPFYDDGIQFGYPIRHFKQSLENKDDQKLVALVEEWFGFEDESSKSKEYFTQAIDAGMSQAVRGMTKNSFLVNSDYAGLLPVHRAILNEDVEMLDLLVELGADINGNADGGPSVAFLAVLKNDPVLLEQLQRRGADLRCSYQLADGSRRSLQEFAKILEKDGLLSAIPDTPLERTVSDSETSLPALSGFGQMLIQCEWFEEAKSWFRVNPEALKDDPEILIDAAGEGNADLIESFVGYGADVNATSFSGPALCAAAEGNHLESARLLLKLGAETEGADDSPMPKTSLFRAVRHGHLEMVELLLQHNADPNAMYISMDCIPINSLALLKHHEKEDSEIYQLLVDHGAKLPTLLDGVKAYPRTSHYICNMLVAEENYSEAIEITSYLIDTQPGASEHYFRGVSFEKTGKFKRALADFKACIELDPEIYEAFLGRSRVYMKRGKWKQAAADLESAIKVNPRDPLAMNALANLLLNVPRKSLLDPQRAVELAKSACEFADEDDSTYQKTLAAAYRAVGDLEQAEQIERSIQRDSN